jgi:tight adherence protein B
VLACAVLVAPTSPRRRLSPASTGQSAVAVGGSGLMSAGGAALALALLVATMGPFVAAAALLVGGTVLLRHRRRAARLRTAGDGRALEGALEVLVSELRVGTHPVRAFAIAAQEAQGAVGASFHAVAARAGLGADVAAGLRVVAAGSARGADWERLAVFWQLASEHGLAISPLMRAAQLDLAERQRFSSRVTAGMAGARATAGILACLPLLGIALGELIGASPVAFLLGRGGGWFLAAGSVLVCAGLLWADHITERVLL